MSLPANPAPAMSRPLNGGAATSEAAPGTGQDQYVAALLARLGIGGGGMGMMRR